MAKLALVVGINSYPAQPLKFAYDDAIAIAEVLEQPAFGFEVTLLCNEYATRDAIRKALRDLFMSEASMCLFFFAGHGDTAPDGVYLRSVDSTGSDEGVDLDYLKRMMARPATGARIAIIDCCFAGAAGLASAGDLESARVAFDGGLRGLANQRVVIAACRASEVSEEVDGHGVFTTHLLDGLSGPAADNTGDITASSMYEYLAAKMAGNIVQQPVFKGDVAGRVVLASGFGRVVVRSLTERDIKTVINKAAMLLDSFEERPSVGREVRLRSGYRADAQALAPIAAWFEKRLQEQPDLSKNKDFSALYKALTAARAKLGTLETGIKLTEGDVVKLMGEGNFGSVWQVLGEGKALAYKVYNPAHLGNREKLKRFQRGFEAMKQLDHPNIVKVKMYTEVPLGFYMDYIDGPNLRALSGGLEHYDAVAILVGVADTLRHTHGRNVVHRDIKPENIIVQYDQNRCVWEPFLTDFDLAWFSAATRMTTDGLGSTYYAAPEQLSAPGSRAAHAGAVDIYSFGQLCFFVLTQVDPVHTSEKNVALLRQRLSGWNSAEAAKNLLELYIECSQDISSRRPKDFVEIWRRLTSISAMLRNAREDRAVSQHQFITELVYQLVGLAPSGNDARDRGVDSFRSRSGRTMLEVSVAERSEPWFDVLVNVRLAEMSGFSTHKDGVLILNQRISEAISEFKDVKMSKGVGAGYEVSISIGRTYMNTTGITRCTHLIGRVIDACERA